MPTKKRKRTCRYCGCTDDDCRQCIAATGVPCHWVKPTMCSRCARTPAAERKYIREADGRRATAKMGRPAVVPVPPEHSLLTVLRPDPERPSYSVCSCSCGVEKSVRNDKISSGETVSCGHARKQRDFAGMARNK